MVTLMATMIPLTEDSKLHEKMGQEPLAEATNTMLMVRILVRLNLHQVTANHLSNDLFLFPFQSTIAMTWAHKDYDRPLRVGDRGIEHAHLLKERLLEEEGMRKKVVEQLETQGAELKGAGAELTTAQTEMAHLKATFPKYWEDTLMEVSHL